ncbi:hypothetical protein Bca101_099205 [Brassica carinata]
MKAIVISSQERQRPKSCLGTIESIVMSVTRRKVGNQDWCEYADQCSFHVLFDRTTEIVLEKFLLAICFHLFNCLCSSFWRRICKESC